jgi:hypothetical protein
MEFMFTVPWVERMSAENTRICGVKVSTIFQFDSPTVQTAANSVYMYKSTFDGNPSNVARGKVYTFKSDFERLQYLMGLYGRTSEGRR